MKSAAAFIQSLRRGLPVDTALSSLAPHELEYHARIPVNVYRASQELGWRFFPRLVIRFVMILEGVSANSAHHAHASFALTRTSGQWINGPLRDPRTSS